MVGNLAEPASAGLEIDKLFREAVKHRASNLHLKVGKPPYLRVNGRLRSLGDTPFTEEGVVQLCAPLLDERHTEAYYRDGGTDFAYVVVCEDKKWRFRINLFQQLGTMALVAQLVEPHIPAMGELNLPDELRRLCTYDQGMILVAGMTGTGKTTTIASMLDWINHTYRKHILTIEDPIEYIFDDDMSLINQREIGESVRDFATAMKHAVREDPDVIMVGEMRDAESFSTAMHAAETGHLVFGTVHAAAAATTVGRILDLFPQEMHPALRSSMCFNMKAIIAQKLLPTVVEKPKRVPIIEIMTFNPTVRKLILEEQDTKLQEAIALGRPDGMQTFDDSLYDFVTRGLIARADAIIASQNPNAFKMRLKGIDVKTSGLL
jgi:twitching motility protein PilT